MLRTAAILVLPLAASGAVAFALSRGDQGRIDLFHLLDHVREGWPVRVTWDEVDGTRYAARVDDA